MKKIAAFLTVALLFSVLSACTQAKGTAENGKQRPDLTVNGEKIIVDEYEYFYKSVRSQIIAEYADKYATTDFSNFWETEFNGKTPAQELETRTIEKCVRAKIELNLCKENGIYDDVSFEGLKLKAQQFNAENENKSGVVGLKSIDLDTFYTYYIDIGVMELKNKLEAEELKPDEDEIQYQTDNMTPETKAQLSDAEIYNSAFDKAVNEKYEKLIAQKINEAEIIKT